MNIQNLDKQVSVSEQLETDAFDALADSGVEILVCNRPEAECTAPTYEAMQAAADRAGLEFVSIPFARGQMTREHCEQFARLLASGKRIHAFCRTGNRSCNMWAGARSLQGLESGEIVTGARAAGFDVSGVVVAFTK
ncbi:TIGR01244 family sulfur transferase [Microbulbifer guangxiensis]|uniref:TIGR01244 family sulfur transferase n=1 Tax=Microbulbifer guangxiensis TaxID=2904249 RepID=UPI001F257D0A|nr:TIGR01244 family sulfur transferase [Microbulbifer guangxiensis]